MYFCFPLLYCLFSIMHVKWDPLSLFLQSLQFISQSSLRLPYKKLHIWKDILASTIISALGSFIIQLHPLSIYQYQYQISRSILAKSICRLPESSSYFWVQKSSLNGALSPWIKPCFVFCLTSFWLQKVKKGDSFSFPLYQVQFSLEIMKKIIYLIHSV